MSEKEIEKNDVVGKKLEDLSEEELEEVQGQGSDEDMKSETLYTWVTKAMILCTTR